ncbi:major facilitator superfamily domain-containing protein 6-like [Paramacrobiotus metropolitanus]|uniref:major facilitator superfamily domain-containing protein 6-like n=1 Tax=Paramacrobiotus metropolitanus TaxID=2943436 RepID=UPI0024463295|nr:major facilitator superfamily domain-containing protein 6-like [Paramacrobiotus metropolitanus]
MLSSSSSRFSLELLSSNMDDYTFQRKGSQGQALTRKEMWKRRLRVNRSLIPLKVLLFLMFGAMTALYPFMTLHMRSVGLTLTEIAFIYAILPFVSCIGPPVCGWLADRIGNYRLVFVGCVIINVITHMLIWFGVPSSAPRSIIVANVTQFRSDFDCSQPAAFAVGLGLNETCSAKYKITENLVFFTKCTTTCLPDALPELCFQHADNTTDCTLYNSFGVLELRNGSLFNASGALQFKSFTTTKGKQVNNILCKLSNPSAMRTQQCKVFCTTQANLSISCLSEIPASRRRETIALYITFRFLAGIAMSALSPMLDALAYQMAKEHHGDLGFNRMFTLIGMALTPPISGLLVDIATRESGYENYSPAFYIFGSLLTVSAVIAYFMSLKVKMPQEHIIRYVSTILKNPKVSIFVLMMLFTGMMWGFLENYLFVFMKQIGSPQWLLGMTNTVSALSALPVVALSTYIIRALGHTKIVMMCCVLYGIRFLCYSFTYDPFLILPVEILEAFTTSLLWVVTSVYCGKIAPDYVATLQGIVMGAHGAIGRGTGSLIGGIMFDYLKPRLTYRIWAGACVALGGFYAVLHYTWLRRIRHTKPVITINGHSADTRGKGQDDDEIAQDFAQTEALMQPVIGANRTIPIWEEKR